MRLQNFLDSSDRRVGIVGVLACVCCLAYFYMVDFAVFSSRGFTSVFRDLLIFYDVKTAWIGVLVCALAAFWHKPAAVLRAIDAVSRHAAAIAALAVLLFSLGALVIYRNYPLCMDEYAAVFQSKVFATGHVFAQLPPSVVNWVIAPGFNGQFFIASTETGRTIEGYWPGFALLLAPFQVLHIPWLCNAALGGLSLILIHRITLVVTRDTRAAGWAVLFALGSSVLWASSISYYSMQAHLTANLLFALLLLEPSPRRCLAAGLVGSLALILHNPFPHALFAAPWLLALCIDARTRNGILPVVVGYLPGIAVAVAWLWLRKDIDTLSRPAAVAALAESAFSWPGAVVLNMRVAAAVKMWVWAVPCLFAFALLGWFRWRDSRPARLMALSALLTFIAYLFVNVDQGHGWGYRYFQSAWGVVPILAGCAFAERAKINSRMVAFAGAAAVLSLAMLVPFQLAQIGGYIDRHLAQIPPPQRPGNNVYFIDPRGGFYLGDTIQSDPQFRTQDLLLLARGKALDEQLVRENWPGAVKLPIHGAVQQWSLGPVDQRVPDKNGERRFVLRFSSADGTGAAPGLPDPATPRLEPKLAIAGR